MTAFEFEAACAEFDGQLVQPMTIADCRAIFDSLRPRLAAGVGLDVQIRGYGSALDPPPLRVDVTIHGAHAVTRSILVS